MTHFIHPSLTGSTPTDFPSRTHRQVQMLKWPEPRIPGQTEPPPAPAARQSSGKGTEVLSPTSGCSWWPWIG